MGRHQGSNPAGTDDRYLWRYNHETGEAAADHAEVRQRDGRPPKFFRWNRTGNRVGPQPVEPGSQVPYLALGDIAHDRHDGAAGSGGLYRIEIDIEFACEGAHCREHLKHSPWRRLGRSFGHCSLLLAGVELADHGASILLGALGELDQGSTNFHQITFGPEHPRDAATPR